MISISHEQARRLLILSLETTRLSDGQWSALQSHLEQCAECCAFQAKLERMERALPRALRSRWEGADVRALGEDSLDVSQRVLADIAARCAQQQLARRVGLWAAALLGLFGLLYFWNSGGWGGLAVSGNETATFAPLPSPTPTPTPLPAFRGLVAYESVEDGNSEIFLLASSGSPDGPDVVNLTNHPADDYAPAFSPDGEWIAFLSKRRTEGDPEGDGGPGKPELYVMHVAGSRLTRLTDSPDLYWQGPLSWSADGQYIALSAQRLDAETGPRLYCAVERRGSAAGWSPPPDRFARSRSPAALCPKWLDGCLLQQHWRPGRCLRPGRCAERYSRLQRPPAGLGPRIFPVVRRRQGTGVWSRRQRGGFARLLSLF